MAETRDVFAGIATLLSAASIGTYRSDGTAYLASETAIVAKQLPAAPDRCIAITSYAIGDEVNMAGGKLNVQIRFRAAPGHALDVDDMREAAFNVLHGLKSVNFGTVFVVQMLRSSSIPMGMDDSKRWEHADNYQIDTGVPGTLLRP